MKWIALIVFALVAFYALGTDDRGRRLDPLGEVVAPAHYPYSARVENLTCRDSMGLVSGVLRNTGSEPIAFATVQMTLGGEFVDAPVIRIQPGQVSSFKVPNYRDSGDCSVVAIRHEKDGRDLR